MHAIPVKLSIPLLLLTVCLLTSCASTTRSSVIVTNAKSDVYTAVVRTVVGNGFQVRHTDRVTGIISGERPLKQLGTNREDARQVRVTVLVEQSGPKAVLTITWTPPEWAFGSFDAEQKEFIDALSTALPDALIICQP